MDAETSPPEPLPPLSPLSDDALVAALEARRLDPAAFTHVEHVRVAWTYLRRAPLLVALARFTGALRGFAAHHGVAGRYHATITAAYLILIHEAALRLPADHSFAELRAANPELFAGGAALLGRYFRAETLAGEAARAAFVVPDGELVEGT
ncbi:MAG: hypothetical protein R3B09_07890 [Nannocystaceae bacterium]